MDFTHKFSVGAVSMDKMLEEYHHLTKTRRYCKACPNYGQYWSCPEYGFDEVIFLKEFKYMYLIGREYTIPREDRQKVISIPRVNEYCKQAMQAIKVQSWKDLIQLEEDIPGTLTLMPGNCHICDIAGSGCARKTGQPCRHTNLMRFSLESLGFDVDAICKFEIGLLLQWPREGHLPEKLCAVMAILTNEKIPMELIKEHFPDAKKSWLRFSEGAPEARNEVRPSVKRQESWIDNQAKQHREKAQDPSYQAPNSWIGFKSKSLDSGDYVKERPWAVEEDEENTVDTLLEHPPLPEVDVPEALKGETADEILVGAVAEAITLPSEEAAAEVPAAEEEDSQFKWLGFKRSVEEAEEAYYKRPIPKFNIPEEEEVSPSVAEEPEPLEVAETVLAVEPQTPEVAPVNAPAPPKTEPAPQPEVVIEKAEEPVDLPDASSVANVLSAAIEIAKDVVGDDFIPAESTYTATETAAPTEAVPEEEDDSKYKWLGFKAGNLEEDDGLQKGGWKKNY